MSCRGRLPAPCHLPPSPARAGFLKKFLFNFAFQRKLHYMKAGWSHAKASPFFDKLVFGKVGAAVPAVCHTLPPARSQALHTRRTQVLGGALGVLGAAPCH